jgi:adenosylmethionine-8-amino-7-oxononanoate aminotransferase
LPKFTPKDNKFVLPDLSGHGPAPWTTEKIAGAVKRHSMFAWQAADPLFNMSILVDRAEGVYLYDKEGKKHIDWASGAVCTNLGHTVPERIIKAVEKQMRQVCRTNPCY